jgi:hypothetical protein
MYFLNGALIDETGSDRAKCMTALQIKGGYRVIIAQGDGSVKGRKPCFQD